MRVDNDVFLGSPFPPEEPAAKNPPDGAMIDYYLPAKAAEVKLEISDSAGKLVRRYSSGDKKQEKLPPMAIAPTMVSEAGDAGERRGNAPLPLGPAMEQLGYGRRI